MADVGDRAPTADRLDGLLRLGWPLLAAIYAALESAGDARPAQGHKKNLTPMEQDVPANLHAEEMH